MIDAYPTFILIDAAGKIIIKCTVKEALQKIEAVIKNN